MNDFISISEFIRNRCHKNPLFVMFVLPAEFEERRHGEGSESENMSRLILFNMLMKLSDCTVFYMVEIELYAWEHQTFKHSFFFLLLVS